MEKLRELGFKGIFDIYYNELLPAHYTEYKFFAHIGYVGKNLELLIPGFKAKPIYEDDCGTQINHPAIGDCKITRLSVIDIERFSYSIALLPVLLTITAADDAPIRLRQPHLLCALYNSSYYVHLNPTDWKYSGPAFIAHHTEVKYLAENLRLSSRGFYQNKYINAQNLSSGEYHAISCDRKKFHTQLVYGLRENNEKFLHPEILCSKLIKAQSELSKKTGKPVILFLPERFALSIKTFFSLSTEKWICDLSNCLHSCDLTKFEINAEQYQSGDVIIAYTGFISNNIFQYLLLYGTTLPPAIEGCNSRELCEFKGRAFIHSASLHDPFIEYPMNTRFNRMQQLHSKASACLKTGKDYDEELLHYLILCLNPESEIYAYHQERAQKFLARPDACEAMLEILKQENIANRSFFSKIKCKL